MSPLTESTRLTLAKTSYPDIRNGIVTNGLVLNLDAGQTASYPGTGTTWTDLSGNGNNGTLVNGPTYSSANGGSLTFNGTNHYATVASVEGITNFQKTNSYSVDFWVNINNATSGNDSAIVEKWSGNDGYPYVFRYKRASDFRIFAGVYGSGASNAIGCEIIATPSAWQHVCGVFDWPNSRLTLYGNGGSVSSNVSISFSQSISNADSLQLMRRGNNSLFCGGTLSAVKIYNRALTAAEVQQNFNCLRMRYGI